MMLLWWLVPCGWAQPTPWWDSAWSTRTRLSFDNAQRSEDLDDLPVLVVLEDGRNFDHSRALPGGDDLRFVDDDGSTELAYEIEQWDEAGVSLLWVRVPRIDGASSTDHVVLYAENPLAVRGEDRAGTWSAEWLGVYHLDGTLFDSTASARHGSDVNTAPVPGRIAGGRDFDGSGDWVALPSDSAFDLTGGLTVSQWVHVDAWSGGDWDALVTKGDQAWRVHRCGSGASAAFSTNSLSNVDLCGTVPLDDGGWHYVAATWDPTTQVKRLWVDGADDVSAVGVTGGLNTTSDPTWLGNNSDLTSRSLDGQLDEVRIAAGGRSVDWLSADHASVTDTLITYTPDLDADGWFADEDCLDGDVAVNPGAAEIPGNGIDDDCMGGDAPLDTGTAPTTDTADPTIGPGSDTGTPPTSGDTGTPPQTDTDIDTTTAPVRTASTSPRPTAAAGCGCDHDDAGSWTWVPVLRVLARGRRRAPG